MLVCCTSPFDCGRVGYHRFLKPARARKTGADLVYTSIITVHSYLGGASILLIDNRAVSYSLNNSGLISALTLFRPDPRCRKSGGLRYYFTSPAQAINDRFFRELRRGWDLNPRPGAYERLPGCLKPLHSHLRRYKRHFLGEKPPYMGSRR